MRDLPLGIRPRLINKTPQEAVAIAAAASCRYINPHPVRTPLYCNLRCVRTPSHL